MINIITITNISNNIQDFVCIYSIYKSLIELIFSKGANKRVKQANYFLL